MTNIELTKFYVLSFIVVSLVCGIYYFVKEYKINKNRNYYKTGTFEIFMESMSFGGVVPGFIISTIFFVGLIIVINL